MVDYHEMTRDELINYIEELKKHRAFSEEDRYLLKILDNSPFTIWGSDRECIIRFWAGQCETLYGYDKSSAIGKDFVDLFVAEDEQKAAREDQLKIIDNGEVFHNIANDHAKNGNTLRLLTNCWRMKAQDSDEYLNIEMGLIIDFFYQEMERLEQIISESRLYKARVTQFIDLTKQIRHQYSERRKNFNKTILECRRQAVLTKKSTEFKPQAEHYRSLLKNFDERLNTLIESYYQRVHESGSSVRCEELTDCFKEEYDVLLDDFADEVINFEEIASLYTPDGVVLGKDTVLKECAIEFEKLYRKAFELQLDINHRSDTYKAQVSKNVNSTIFQYYQALIKRVEASIKILYSIQESIYAEIGSALNYNAVTEIRISMHSKFSEAEKTLNEIDDEFRKGHS